VDLDKEDNLDVTVEAKGIEDRKLLDYISEKNLIQKR
jgi:hypothetical protein